jgi:carbon monoxide dehydrogenase subunit G
MTTVAGERAFDAPPERVFELLTNPAVIAGAMPGVRSHRVIDEDHWEAKVKLPIPLLPAVTVQMEVVERVPPTHAGLRAHSHVVQVTSRFDLRAEGARTVMRWETEVHMPGGGHGLERVARAQAEHTLDAVERAL